MSDVQDLITRLRETWESVNQRHGRIVQGVSGMTTEACLRGIERHISDWELGPVPEAADALEAQAAEIERLTREQDALREALTVIASLAAMVGSDLVGRVEGGKSDAVLQCAYIARAALAKPEEEP